MKYVKKIVNITSKVVGAVFIFGLVLTCLNKIVFVSSIQDKYIDSKWTGTWQSERMGNVKGRLIINMPDTLPVNTDFKVDALIYYDIWSFYKTGSTKEIKLTCFFDNDDSSAGESKINTQNNKQLTFKAKFSDSSGQRIEYSGVSNNSKTMILGGYKSYQPGDLGIFKMKKRN
jgi:hypothetical protein